MGENTDIQIELLKDTLDDLRVQNKFIKRIVCILSAIVAFCIIAFIGLFIYSHERFIKFVIDYDVTIESSITTDNGSQNEGSVSVNRAR